MSPRASAGPEAFFCLMLAAQFPRLCAAARVEVVVREADHLFVVQSYRAGVLIAFSHGAARHPSLAAIVHEAGTSAERHVHGLTHATRSQLDPIDWWIWNQRQLPCSE